MFSCGGRGDAGDGGTLVTRARLRSQLGSQVGKKSSGFQDIQDCVLIMNYFFFTGVFMLSWEVSKGILNRAWLEQF